jgi:Flp pilus assembly pilin Flp
MSLRLRISREDGQGLVEYALIILLVALAVISTLTAFGTGLSANIQNIVTSI